VVVNAPAVQKPATADEVARILREASEGGLAVTPIGGGRASEMGDPLERCDIELHVSRLDRVLEHSHGDMVVSVEAGITIESLQSELRKKGQFLPLDPFNSPGSASAWRCRTGGSPVPVGAWSRTSAGTT